MGFICSRNLKVVKMREPKLAYLFWKSSTAAGKLRNEMLANNGRA